MEVYAALHDRGVPAVPHVYWGTVHDLDRWGAWLHANPGVSMVAVDLQTLDPPRDWEDGLGALRRLRALAPDVAALPRRHLYPLRREALHACGLRTRSNLLCDLAELSPVLVKLGRRGVGTEVTRLIADVADWWP